MPPLDEDTSILRHRIAILPIELRRPVAEPQTRARGIGMGILLGIVLWILALAVVLALWHAKH